MNESALWRFLQEDLASRESGRIDDHLGGCSACRQTLDRLVGSLPGPWHPGRLGATEGRAGDDAGTTWPGFAPRALLATRGSGSVPRPEASPHPTGPPVAADRPARLRLFGEIARGGMGAIYKARDVDLGRDLAVKVLLEKHHGKPELARRFVTEARVAGQLQHPGAVPVHELGVLADGRPYFAMKLVEGRDLEDLLGERASPSEDLTRFLGVFEQVCQTVAYAHARGVIHRDLKPANVMVGRFGEVQVMDWGLAKVLAGADAGADASGPDETTGEVATEQDRQGSDDTEAGSVLGTWAYMPPEQARGLVAQVDRRSDVFSLGAILTQILTGQPPYVGPDPGSVRLQAIEGRPDGVSARLAGCGAEPELIRLAVRCLAPNPADRPADGGEVASAVAAYRAGVEERLHEEQLARERQEVQAALGRRHQRALAAAGLGVVLALSAGVVASSVFALREHAAREKATRQALLAEESQFLLGDVLAQADPASEPSRDITLRDAVDRLTEKLNGGALSGSIKTPESHAGVRISLGKIYFNLGEYRRSRELFAEAHRIARDALGESHPTSMRALDQLGKTHIFLEEFAEAERALTRAYALQRSFLGPEHEDTIHSYAKLGDLYADMGKLDRALEIGERVLRLRRRLWGAEYEFTLVSMNHLGLLYRDLGRPKDALPLFEEAERVARRTLGQDSPAALTYLHNRALACASLGRRDESLGHLSECLAGKRRVLGDRHLSTLKTEHGLATLLRDSGRLEESRSLSEATLGRLAADDAGSLSFRGAVLLNLGKCGTALGDYAAAEPRLREAREVFLKKFGPEHKFTRNAAAALEELRRREAGARVREGSPCEQGPGPDCPGGPGW
jgi:tetratricopeptide (TPR) repeat protein/tRNA A-37 threonylcarbamoyl transferase component Bud32